MDTNNKEEIIEELDDIETSTPLQNDEIMPDKKIEDEIKVDIIQDTISTIPEDSPVIDENNGEEIKPNEKSIQIDNQVNEEKAEEVKEEQKDEEKSKKSKMLLLVLLFILLIIDVAALVIYIIGIDKVLGFIK